MTDQWRDAAACLGTDYADLWFEHDYAPPPLAVRQICGSCPVQTQCLDYALQNNEEYGVWGGTTPRQRRAMRRSIQHGTWNAYNNLKCPCEPCKEAGREYHRKWRRGVA